MFINLKRSEILEIILMLKEFIDNDNEYSKQFNVFLQTNYNRLIEDAKITLKTKPEKSYKFSLYENAVQDLQIELSRKDDNGNPVQREDGALAIPIEIKGEYDRRLNELNEQYKETIEEYKEDLKEYDEILNEEIGVNIVKISFKYLPEQYNYNYTNLLIKLVKENKEELEELL